MSFDENLGNRLAYYLVVASWGTLVMITMLGKYLRFKYRKIRDWSIPAPVLAGIAAVIGWSILFRLAPTHFTDLRESWGKCLLLILNICFASLFFSIKIPTTLPFLIHEAMPQLLYAQILCWGQYVVGVSAGIIIKFIIPETDEFVPILTVAGLECGWDSLILSEATVYPHLSQKILSTIPAARASAMIGAFLSIIVPIILINLKKYSHLVPKNNYKSQLSPDHNFLFNQNTSDFRCEITDAPISPNQNSHYSLGFHIGTVSLTFTLAYAIELFLVLLESHVWGEDSFILSSIPSISLLMVTCYFVVKYFGLFKESHRLSYTLFSRMSSTSLEFTIVMSITSLDFSKFYDDEIDFAWKKNLISFLFVIFAIICWHIFAFLYLAKKIVPNFWFPRAIAECSQALGMVWPAYMFISAMDPIDSTPLLYSFACKQIIHCIFLSGGLFSTHTLFFFEVSNDWEMLLISLFIFICWICYYHFSYKPKFKFENNHRRTTKTEETNRNVDDENMGISLINQTNNETKEIHSNSITSQTEIAFNSDIFDNINSPNELQNILPTEYKKSEWKLIYSKKINGSGIEHFEEIIKNKNDLKTNNNDNNNLENSPCLLVIQDSWGFVFGGFCSELLRMKENENLGNSYSFVFCYKPKFLYYECSDSNAIKFTSDYIIFGDKTNPAIKLNRTFDFGVSNGFVGYFGNNCLASNTNFRVQNVEIWSLI
eukprot:c21343_g1_i2.p1 GENE.c21343_g1_i2~~c21343_g1_i2.p1  ORF type:complete len:713 (-),score=194.02 c21343_g1_i2:62-2200(-)